METTLFITLMVLAIALPAAFILTLKARIIKGRRPQWRALNWRDLLG